MRGRRDGPASHVPRDSVQALAAALADIDLNRLDSAGWQSAESEPLRDLGRAIVKVFEDFYGRPTCFLGNGLSGDSSRPWLEPADLQKLKLQSEIDTHEVRRDSISGLAEDFTLSRVGVDVNVDTLNSLLTKTVLYGWTSVMVMPIDVHWQTDSNAGWRQFRPIAQLNAQYRPLLTSGLTVVLPSFFVRSNENREGPLIDIGEFWRAPKRQEAELLRYLPLNSATVNRSMETQVVHQFFLSYFPGCDLRVMRKIVENESAAFKNFTSWLKAQLADLSRQQSQNGMQQVFDKIDSGVNDLRIEAAKLKRLRVLDGVRLGAFSVGVAANIANIPSWKTAATIIGAASMLDLAKEYVARRSTRLDMRKNSFYVPYLISGHSR